MRRLRRLIHKRVTRWSERAFVAEGAELVRTGLVAGHLPEAVFVAAEGSEDPHAASVVDEAEARGVRVYELAPGVVAKVADTVTPQPVLAVFAMVDVDFDALGADGLVVVLDDVRDPGNAGTVLRSADAAGAAGVVFAPGSVDPYNPKTVRASAGSLFHLPVVVADSTVGALEELAGRGFRRLGAVVVGGEDYTAVDWRLPTALVLGNEATGLPDGLDLEGTVGIPMAGRAESLNVGVACAVLCFEALRQRRATGEQGARHQEASRARSTMP